MNDAAHSFFDDWSIYNEVLARNSMHHDDIYLHVDQYFAERFGDKPFSILDLGCGSAHHLAACLRARVVTRYVGYDLSQVALDHARQNLASIGREVTLHCDDLLAGVEEAPPGFDLIFSSFALHHLTSDEKARFYRLARRKLADQGALLVIDTFRNDDESRDEYLARYCDWLRSRCPTLPAHALNSICDHIATYDFPETPSVVRAMADAVGFAEPTELARYGWHRVWHWRKGGSDD